MNSTVREVFHAAAASSVSLAVNTLCTLCKVEDEFWPWRSYAGDGARPGTYF
jgi:hypothetical protein